MLKPDYFMCQYHQFHHRALPSSTLPKQCVPREIASVHISESIIGTGLKLYHSISKIFRLHTGQIVAIALTGRAHYNFKLH